MSTEKVKTQKTNTKTKAPKNDIKLQNNFKNIKAAWQLYVLLLLPVIYIIIFAYVPMYGVQIAFKDFRPSKGIAGSAWADQGLFEHFKILTNAKFKDAFVNTIVVSVYTLIAGFPIPILLALSLNVMRNKVFKKTVQMVSYLPHFISTVVMVSILTQFFNTKVGLFGQILKTLVPGATYTVSPMGSANAFPHLYVWSGVWQNMGWSTIIYLAALASIDMEQTEAAMIDGATRFQRVIHIDIPAILPTAIILLIMDAGKIMSVGFEKAFLMQNDTNLNASEIISTYSYKRGFIDTGLNNFSQAAAIGLFNSVINLILVVTVNKISRKVSDTSLW
ncbi:MAG: sugar ABC transporter permease [Ruminococcaceae bacterium]|nr:sugar ABC transporter permease [Oscillospiraceae bacterium]